MFAGLGRLCIGHTLKEGKCTNKEPACILLHLADNTNGNHHREASTIKIGNVGLGGFVLTSEVCFLELRIMAATLGLDSGSFLPKFADAQNIALDRDIIALRKQLQDLDSKALDHTDTISVLKEHVGRAEKDVVLASFKLSEASKAFANEEHLHQLDLRRLVWKSTKSMNPRKSLLRLSWLIIIMFLLRIFVSLPVINIALKALACLCYNSALHLGLVTANIQSNRYWSCTTCAKGCLCEAFKPTKLV